jgi:hypothetical protein
VRRCWISHCYFVYDKLTRAPTLQMVKLSRNIWEEVVGYGEKSKVMPGPRLRPLGADEK